MQYLSNRYLFPQRKESYELDHLSVWHPREMKVDYGGGLLKEYYDTYKVLQRYPKLNMTENNQITQDNKQNSTKKWVNFQN